MTGQTCFQDDEHESSNASITQQWKHIQQVLRNNSVNWSIGPTNCPQALCAISLLPDSKQTCSIFKDECYSASLVPWLGLGKETEISFHTSARLSIREQIIKWITILTEKHTAKTNRSQYCFSRSDFRPPCRTCWLNALGKALQLLLEEKPQQSLSWKYQDFFSFLNLLIHKESGLSFSTESHKGTGAESLNSNVFITNS